MLKIVLYHFRSTGIQVTVEAFFDEEKLVIEGYDFGRTVDEWWGDSDYEYSLTVYPGEVNKLYLLLAVDPENKDGLLGALASRFNSNTCFSEIRNFLEVNGIRSEGFCWT
jgi:hypothetical protein